MNELDAGTKTHAQVLREIADSAACFAKEYNRGFVASQHCGYLRREPDAANFNNRLTYLNDDPNDYQTMVHGYVNFIEHRSRFGNH